MRNAMVIRFVMAKIGQKFQFATFREVKKSIMRDGQNLDSGKNV